MCVCVCVCVRACVRAYVRSCVRACGQRSSDTLRRTSGDEHPSACCAPSRPSSPKSASFTTPPIPTCSDACERTIIHTHTRPKTSKSTLSHTRQSLVEGAGAPLLVTPARKVRARPCARTQGRECACPTTYARVFVRTLEYYGGVCLDLPTAGDRPTRTSQAAVR